MAVDRVSFLAFHDWNSRGGDAAARRLESIGDPLSDAEIRELVSTVVNFKSLVETNPPRERMPPVDHPVDGDQDTGVAYMAGEPGLPAGATVPDDSGAVIHQQKHQHHHAGSARATAEHLSPDPPAPPVIPQTSPPNGGGGPVVCARKSTAHKPPKSRPTVTGDQDQVRARLQAWLARQGTTVEHAVKREMIDLGGSAATLYNLVNGQRLAPVTVRKIAAALDLLDATTVSAPPVEQLPNKLAPITGLIPLPKLVAPPRCAQVP